MPIFIKKTKDVTIRKENCFDSPLQIPPLLKRNFCSSAGSPSEGHNPPRGFPRKFASQRAEGSDPMLVTLQNCWRNPSAGPPPKKESAASCRKECCPPLPFPCHGVVANVSQGGVSEISSFRRLVDRGAWRKDICFPCIHCSDLFTASFCHALADRIHLKGDYFG